MKGVVGITNPASAYSSKLSNVKHYISLESDKGVNNILVFHDDKWDEEWNLFRRSGKEGLHFWLVDVNKCLLPSLRSEGFSKDDTQINSLKEKCLDVNGEFNLINYGNVCELLPFEQRGAICMLPDKTIIHASLLLESDWQQQIETFKVGHHK